MSFLEDGEYELDVSILLDNPSTNNNSFNDNIAIRYGFIPDSMDQSKPLKLYQQDQTCILKATLSDSDPTPIFLKVYRNDIKLIILPVVIPIMMPII